MTTEGLINRGVSDSPCEAGYRLTTAQVARRLHVSPGRVRQLDHELGPERCACGGRRYDPERVAAYEAKRAADAAELARVRAARMADLRARRRAYQAERLERRRQAREAGR